MKISEMTDIACRLPFPLLVAMDRLGERDPVFKKHVIGIDYAVSSRMSDAAIRILIDDFLDYVEQKYFIDKNKERARIVFFLADKRVKK